MTQAIAAVEANSCKTENHNTNKIQERDGHSGRRDTAPPFTGNEPSVHSQEMPVNVCGTHLTLQSTLLSTAVPSLIRGQKLVSQ